MKRIRFKEHCDCYSQINEQFFLQLFVHLNNQLQAKVRYQLNDKLWRQLDRQLNWEQQLHNDLKTRKC